MGNKRVPLDRRARFKVSTLFARDATLHAISRSRLAVHRMDSVRNCSPLKVITGYDYTFVTLLETTI